METTKLKDLSFEAICGIIAKVIHSANKAYADAIGGRLLNPSWEEAPEQQRQDLLKAIASTIINPQTPQFSHEQWCLAREKEGWTKDINYNPHRKTHPSLVPFDQLTFEEQFKSHLYMGIASIFCGGLGILEMPAVAAARKILQDKWSAESEACKLGVEDDDDMSLEEKLQEAKDKLAAAEGASDIINGVDKTYKPVMDNENGEQDGELAAVKTAAAAAGTGPDGKPVEVAQGIPVGDTEGPKPNLPEAVIDPEEGRDPAPDSAPETPLPSADEILDNKPADFTAEDLAKDVLGANNVGEVTEGPKPNLPTEEKPVAAKKPAKKKSSK